MQCQELNSTTRKPLCSAIKWFQPTPIGKKIPHLGWGVQQRPRKDRSHPRRDMWRQLAETKGVRGRQSRNDSSESLFPPLQHPSGKLQHGTVITQNTVNCLQNRHSKCIRYWSNIRFYHCKKMHTKCQTPPPTITLFTIFRRLTKKREVYRVGKLRIRGKFDWLVPFNSLLITNIYIWW